MSSSILPFSTRLRRSPFFDRSHAYGAQSYTVYNHMLIPAWFRSPEEDYAHLRSAVQLWDTGAERQVEIRGPDATRLVQMSTPRDISGMGDDRCYYIPAVDAGGRMLNDPVLVKLGENRYWVSLADSDLLFYYKGLAAGFGLDVTVFEPAVAPLGIQGALAEELVERVFGAGPASIRLFRHCRVDVGGRPMILARSGFSRKGRFELYFEGTDGNAIWDRLAEAGRDLDVFAGCPSQIERIETGLLSYNTDITLDHTPFEVGLDAFCTMDRETGCLGHDALLDQQTPQRQIRPVEIAGGKIPAVTRRWPLTDLKGRSAGNISSAAWSPEQHSNIAIAMIDREYWDAETDLVVHSADGPRDVRVLEKFWGRN